MNRMQQSIESAQAIAASDALAVERTLAGERDAFRVLVERHSHNVFRLAYRMTRNQHDAEEVVQEAFLRAYQKLGQFAARANFGTWVYRIAANYAIDRMRQKQKEDARRQAPGPQDGNGIMKHMTEEELIAYREGVVEQQAAISEHLAACEECRAELERIEAVLAALDTLPVPDPGADYGRRVWQQIASRLPEKSGAGWQTWFQPRRLASAAAI